MATYISAIPAICQRDSSFTTLEGFSLRNTGGRSSWCTTKGVSTGRMRFSARNTSKQPMARDISRIELRNIWVLGMKNKAPYLFCTIRLFHGAGGSAAEVQSQLYTALDQDYISQETFNRIYQELEVVAKQLSRFITYLKGSG